MNLFTQAIISGLMTGALYALLGIGLVLVYRTAASSIWPTGSLSPLRESSRLYSPRVGRCLAARASPSAISRPLVVLDQPAPLCPASSQRVARGMLILITLGAAFVARGVMILLIGTDPGFVSAAPRRPRPSESPGGAVPLQGIALVVLGFGYAATVGLFLNATRSASSCWRRGKSVAAELLGVDVERARLMAYGIAGLLGAGRGAADPVDRGRFPVRTGMTCAASSPPPSPVCRRSGCSPAR